jgi:alpha-beta hydrolase superfamily lysophospholipase
MLSIDVYGHGLSDGPRLSTQFQQAVEDYCHLVDTTATAPLFAGLPRFIVGQSFGGLVASYVVRRDQGKWAGLVLSAAAIGVDWDAGKLVAYGVFSACLARVKYVS